MANLYVYVLQIIAVIDVSDTLLHYASLCIGKV